MSDFERIWLQKDTDGEATWCQDKIEEQFTGGTTPAYFSAQNRDLNKARQGTKEISVLYEQSQAEIAALKRENKTLREFVELTQSKWEEFGCDDGIVTVKYPWAIQERMREIALLTAEEPSQK